MNMRISSCYLLIALIAVSLLGCSETVTVPVPNDPPTIAFTFDRMAVVQGANVTLSVSVSDPDDDPLTVTWDITRGVLNPDDQGKSLMSWRAPTQAGTDTVTVSVSDGTHTVSVVDTIVVGYLWTADINGGIVWDMARSPLVLSMGGSPPRLVVDGQATLTIEAGVTVYVQSEMIFDVPGTLLTNGTADNMVKFLPNSRNPDPGFWEGMLGSKDAGSGAPPGTFDLHYTRITYADENILLTNGSSADLLGCQLYFSREVAMHHDSGSGALIVRNSQITDNFGDGIVISSFSTYPDQVAITGNRISFNGGMGIVIDLIDPDGTTPINISNNEITWNSFYGIHLVRAVYPTINQNALHTNDRLQANAADRRNLRLEPGFIGNLPEIDATNNYWLTTDSLVIEQTVFDSRDDAQVNTRVRFWPWLNSAP
jgi:parallel beta-helix repeat protein